MNWICGKAAGFCGNSKGLTDYVKEGNFFQLEDRQLLMKQFVPWGCLIIHSFVGLSISFSIRWGGITERC
jgi:hypothetical protein